MKRKCIAIQEDQDDLLRELAYLTRETETAIIRKMLAKHLPAMLLEVKKVIEFDESGDDGME